jgi:ABC-type bacteriocin/lantibiotic exporter with double-glycine peptidase domain
VSQPVAGVALLPAARSGSEPVPRLLVPEVVQTSGMDCGPATLACLLRGFDVPASYARLRDACQTGVDGTSIDAMQDVATLLGLDAEQMIVPADHLLLNAAGTLPAIVVTRLPGGLTHFVVVWRRHGPLLQVMDPGVGRRWVPARRFLAEVYVHELAIPAEVFAQWARSAALGRPLLRRLTGLGVGRPTARALLADAAAAPTGEALAALDAAARQAAARRPGRRRRAGPGVAALAGARAAADEHWFARPVPAQPESVTLRGAVLVRVSGRRADAPTQDELPADLRAAVAGPDPRPGRFLWQRLLGLGGWRLAAGALVAALAAAGTVVEAVLFRALLSAGSPGADLGRAVAALVALAAVLLALDVLLAGQVAAGGRSVETGLRAGLLRRLPVLPDRYVRSRPLSDLAERAHRLHRLRELPALAVELVTLTTQLLLLPLVIGLIEPASAVPAAVTAGAATAVGYLLVPVQAERDLRQRNHVGALARCYLDALAGLAAIRAHRAEAVLTAEHRGLLDRWAAAVRGVHRAALTAELAQGAVGLAGVVWLLASAAGRVTDAATFLLLAYWAVALPMLGQQAGALARRYPAYRSAAVRLLEPLTAPVEDTDPTDPTADRPDPAAAMADPADPADPLNRPADVAVGPVGGLAGPADAPSGPAGTPAEPADDPAAPGAGGGAGAHRGVEVRLAGVTVVAGGLAVLAVEALVIPPGAAVAVVGRSGSGKSTLAGLLLGWHVPAAGQVLVDGRPLDPAELARLRRHTAWVDPTVTLWNASVAANLGYGVDGAVPPWVADQVGLAPVVAGLAADPDQPLGERGWLLSGGEAQRVRLGRAAAQRDVRLAVLDEPFRGLDRERRRALLSRVRTWWPGATLIFVTHDVADTLGFDRVLLVENGQIVEDGAPAVLAARAGSGYRALLAAEQAVAARFESWPWRRLRVGPDTAPVGPDRALAGPGPAAAGPGTAPTDPGAAVTGSRPRR